MIFKKADSTTLSNLIANNSETPLQLVSRMTSVTDRINLKSAKAVFDNLRTSFKIKLPDDLIDSIDDIIMNNMTTSMEKYAYDLSGIRYDSNVHCRVDILPIFRGNSMILEFDMAQPASATWYRSSSVHSYLEKWEVRRDKINNWDNIFDSISI